MFLYLERKILPQQTTTMSIHYSCVRKGGGGCKDLKRSQKFRLFSNLTFENINNTFEARDQEKEVFMDCSQLHWSDKKTVDENVSLLCILIVILVCQARNCV